ncbi:MAG: prolipoprotein diacylglyceryl transferase [Candidatus Sumerlaeota bacterium]|nr:prolipoprotein diacylglyceryl transferase [Candidatus Sumerlaeota bacterium]
MYPVLFHIFGFPISPYGVLLAMALLTGVALAVWRARQVSVPDEVILDTAFFATLAGFAGGRITYILTHWDAFIQQPWALIFDRSGFSFLGGLILAMIVTLWVIRRRGQNFFTVADVMAPSVAFGHVLGRLGCLCAGCCYGAPVTHGFEWLGAVYHLPDAGASLTPMPPPPALYDQIESHLLPTTATASLPCWPTQLIESGGNLIIFLFLIWLWRRRKFEGHVFCGYLIAYAALRFLVEFMRGDTDRGVFYGLSTSQWLSLGCAAAAGIFWASLKQYALAPATGSETKKRKSGDGSARASRKATPTPAATAADSAPASPAKTQEIPNQSPAPEAASVEGSNAGEPPSAATPQAHGRKRKKSGPRKSGPGAKKEGVEP